MASLSRTESAARAAVLEVHHYHVELELSETERFRSVSTITFTARAPHTFVDVVAERLVGAELDGHRLDLAGWKHDRLPIAGLGGRHVLRVEAWMTYSHDGEGLHRFVDPADGEAYLYAMSFLDAAPRWFACFDQPDLKATFELELTCPPDWTVRGNGPARQSAPGRWHVAATPPIATYTMTVVAGPYHSVRGDHDGIALGLSVRRSLAAELDRDAAALLELTAESFDAYHRLFGVRYPFGEYHQAFVPEFNAGAMENPGCVTFRDQLMFRSRPSEAQVVSRAITVVHEMAHMWFGDLVTMQWWDDLWLNESFADYLSHRVTAEITNLPAWELFGITDKAWGYDADRRRSTHPVAGNGAADSASALNDFDGISYAKGAALLRQLAGYLGDEMFLGGLRQHITAHAYGNATFADLLAAWTDHAGPGTPDAAGLANWAEQWLRRAGVDLKVSGSFGGRHIGPGFGEHHADRQAQHRHQLVAHATAAAWVAHRRHRRSGSGGTSRAALQLRHGGHRLVARHANDRTIGRSDADTVHAPVISWPRGPS